MKTFKLLATLLLVVLSVGFYSCSKNDNFNEDIGYYESGSSQTCPKTVHNQASSYGINYDNIEMMTWYRYEPQSIGIQDNFTGLKNGKLWMSSYYCSTKIKIAEWIDLEKFNNIRKGIYMGYGEYKDITISRINLKQVEKTIDNSYIALFNLCSSESTYTENFCLFHTPTSDKKVPNVNGNKIEKWYDHSIMIDNCCYTPSGDSIFVCKKSIDDIDVETVFSLFLSYTESVILYKQKKSNSYFYYVTKFNYETGKCWESDLNISTALDAKVEIGGVNASTNIWKYKINVTNYDGTKKEYSFTVDINDGKITT